MPGHHAGHARKNKGRVYPADPPTVDEIVAVMRQTPPDRHGLRLRALIVVLWRRGLRIQEALSLIESDLDPRRGSILIRRGKGNRRREVGIDARSAVVGDRRSRGATPLRPRGRRQTSVRATSAPPCPRGRTRARGGAAPGYPKATREIVRLDDQRLPPGDRR